MTLNDVVATFRNEMANCIKEIKSEVIDCRKLIQQVDVSTTKRIF